MGGSFFFFLKSITFIRIIGILVSNFFSHNIFGGKTNIRKRICNINDTLIVIKDTVFFYCYSYIISDTKEIENQI